MTHKSDGAQTAPYRILSCDGGGIHALSYLPIIDHLERFLGSSVAGGKHFQLLAGTSTGSIVATALKVGYRAEEIIGLYCTHSPSIFTPLRPWNRLFHRYSSAHLRDVLLNFFVHPKTKRPLLWSDLHESSTTVQSAELIVTLWNATTGNVTYLSTDPARPGQESTLHQAFVADIITACCSAPYFFPSRAFQTADTVTIYCDAGIAGVNNPAAYATAIMKRTLGHIQPLPPLHILSFGSGESRNAFCVDDMTRWTFLESLLNTVDALMTSSTVLVDDFYRTAGSALGIKYLRTSHPRGQRRKFDDVANIDRILKNYAVEQVTYELLGLDQSPTRTLSPAEFERVCREEFNMDGSPASKQVISTCRPAPVVRPLPEEGNRTIVPTWEVRASWPANRSLLRRVSGIVLFVGSLIGGVGVSEHYRFRARDAETIAEEALEIAQLEADNAKTARNKLRRANDELSTQNGKLKKALSDISELQLKRFQELEQIVAGVPYQIVGKPGSQSFARTLLRTVETELSEIEGRHEHLGSRAAHAIGRAAQLQGDVELDTGHTTLAAGCYNRGREIFKRLCATNPADRQTLRELAGAQIKVGDVAQQQGDLGRAMDAFGESMKVYADLLKRDSSDAETQLDLSISHGRMSDAWMQQRELAQAKNQASMRRTILDRLSKLTPQQRPLPSYLVNYERCRSYRQLGEIAGEEGNLPEGRKVLNQAITIADELALDRTDVQAQLELAGCHTALAAALEKVDPVGSMTSYQKALEVAYALTQIDSEDTRSRFISAQASYGCGDLLLGQSTLEQANARYNSGTELYYALAFADSANAQAQLSWAISRVKLARLRTAQGRPSAAAVEHWGAFVILQCLVQKGKLVERARFWIERLR